MARRKSLGGIAPRKRQRRNRSGETPGIEQAGKVLKSGTITLPAGSIPSPSGGRSSAVDFTHALMQGHPLAEEAVRQAMNRPERLVNINMPPEEASLADKFVAETYTLPKRLGLNKHQANQVEPILQSYRQDMRKAHRFVLDNDFVRYASEISSTTPPAKLLARVSLASLPYDITWIEFDLKTKVRTMRAIHKMDDSKFDYDQVADRLGLIIRRLSDTEMVVEMVCETHGDYGLIGTTICYFFSVREYSFTQNDGRGTGCRPFMGPDLATVRKNAFDTGHRRNITEEDAEVIRAIGPASLWGYSYGGKSTVIDKMAQMKDLRLPEFLMRHGTLGTGRMRSIIEGLVPTSGTEPVANTIASLLVSETTEFTGMMRWIVTVLAMLNEVPTRADFVKPTHTMRAGLTKRVAAFDYHRLALRLPKTKVFAYIERKLRNVERRHKAHEVMAHWRTYLHVEQACPPDEHAWEYDEEHGYALCGKCMGYRRRIPEHVRGDPKLGWVQKSYVVKLAKQE